MNFAELVAEVKELTKRPDLGTRIDQAVRAATLSAHQRDYFARDMREVTIQFTAARYIHNFEPRDLLPRFRKVKYLRQFSGVVGEDPGKFYKHIQIENAFDAYGTLKTDCFYISGQLLQLRSSTEIQYLILGYYQHPIAISEGFDSWIAEEYPWMIVYDAARIIFKGIGHDEQARYMDGLVREQYQAIMASEGTDEVPTS